MLPPLPASGSCFGAAFADLRALFEPAARPYFVSSSHVSRTDGVRRFHHMMVIVADPDSPSRGPIVFDVTGLRGFSVRRVAWRGLLGYLGPTLAGSDRQRYDLGSALLAVLRPTDRVE